MAKCNGPTRGDGNDPTGSQRASTRKACSLNGSLFVTFSRSPTLMWLGHVMHLRALAVGAGLFALISALAFTLVGRSAPSRPDAKTSNPSSGRPVLVELFTSEGCSSCPPADSLLKELSEDQPVDGAQIIALEEHVDYWNHLGWSDPFSSPDFTRRQEAYATTLPDGGVYTPQMIVDGRIQFVGSRSNEAREKIQLAAAHLKSRLLLTPVAASNPQSRSFELRLDATPPRDSELWLAVTEKNLQSHVTAGENSGETLQHAPVVRLLRKIQSIPSHPLEPIRLNFDLRPGWNPANLTAVVFLADSHSHQITAAGLSPATP